MAGLAFLMSCLHTFSCEQVPRKSLQTLHPSQWDYAMMKRKNIKKWMLVYWLAVKG
jgi:hypothetical protein